MIELNNLVAKSILENAKYLITPETWCRGFYSVNDGKPLNIAEYETGCRLCSYGALTVASMKRGFPMNDWDTSGQEIDNHPYDIAKRFLSDSAKIMGYSGIIDVNDSHTDIKIVHYMFDAAIKMAETNI